MNLLVMVGILLWEMFFGTPPLDPVHELASYVPSGAMPRGVEAVMMRMLEPRPEDRYTATAALRDIIGCTDFPRSGRDVLAATLRERLPHRIPNPGRPSSTAETQEPTRPLLLGAPYHVVHLMIKMRRRRRRKALLAVMAVVGALSLAVYGLASRAAVELAPPVLDLPGTAEPLPPAPVRMAAPERAPDSETTERVRPPTHERARSPMPSQHEHKPAASTAAAPETPTKDFRVMDLPPETPEPIQTGAGATQWVRP